MKLKDIKVGQVLVLSDPEFAIERTNVMVCKNSRGKKCISGPGMWFDLDCFDEYLEYGSCLVVEIYDRAHNALAYSLDTNCRKLIWKREE